MPSSESEPEEGPEGDPEEKPQEVELRVASSRGKVYVRLPSGGALELTPEMAKSLGGSLLNESRAAKKQRKAMRRSS